MKLFKHYGYIYLALHIFIDLILALKMYHWFGNVAPSLGFIFACVVLSLFLFFGIKNEEIPGRNGIRANISSEPFAYWSGFILLIISRLTFTVIMFLYGIGW